MATRHSRATAGDDARRYRVNPASDVAARLMQHSVNAYESLGILNVGILSSISSIRHSSLEVMQGQFRNLFVEKRTSSSQSIRLRWQPSSRRALVYLQ